MTDKLDPLLHPYRVDIAAAHLEGQVETARFVEPQRMQVSEASAPVHAEPRFDSEMISEALHGEHVDTYEDNEGWAWGQLCADGYVGYLPARALTGNVTAPTHRVCVARTFTYWMPDIKSAPAGSLTLNARISIAEEEQEFYRTQQGAFVFKSHIAALETTAADFVSVAEGLLGAPYLWGGKSIGGIDCSGLVQVACEAAGIAAPRDSYMQRETLGAPLHSTDPADLKRGDIIFWKGHVGIMADPVTLLHATAHTMLTITEPVDQAIRRIADGGAPVLQVNRLDAGA